ncbi:MAG: hypothetical protein WC068_05840 [Caulobacter sp.]
MTDDKIQTLKDDIAFMRALAQEGSSAPLLGGSILVAAGVTFAVAGVVHWSVMSGLVNLPKATVGLVWPAALFVFLGLLLWLRRGGNSRPGAQSPGNRAASTAWASMGWTIFVIALAIAILAWRTQSYIPALIFPPLILGLYGMGWSVAAAMTGKRWIWMTAIGSYAGALLVAWLSVDPIVYLVYSVALLLLMALPGFILMRQEPSDTI